MKRTLKILIAATMLASLGATTIAATGFAQHRGDADYRHGRYVDGSQWHGRHGKGRHHGRRAEAKGEPGRWPREPLSPQVVALAVSEQSSRSEYAGVTTARCSQGSTRNSRSGPKKNDPHRDGDLAA